LTFYPSMMKIAFNFYLLSRQYDIYIYTALNRCRHFDAILTMTMWRLRDSGVPISEAINRGDIVIEYSSTRRSLPVADIVNIITVRRRIVDHEYTITGAVDARTAESVDCVDAVSRGIIDFTDPAGEFVDTRTGARMPLHDAVEYGWVS